jgi:hypothetical protein
MHSYINSISINIKHECQLRHKKLNNIIKNALLNNLIYVRPIGVVLASFDWVGPDKGLFPFPTFYFLSISTFLSLIS